MGRIGIVFEVSEEFFPLCLTRLLRKLADLSASFKVLSAVFRYRPSEVVSSSKGGKEVWRWPWCVVSVVVLHIILRLAIRLKIAKFEMCCIPKCKFCILGQYYLHRLVYLLQKVCTFFLPHNAAKKGRLTWPVSHRQSRDSMRLVSLLLRNGLLI